MLDVLQQAIDKRKAQSLYRQRCVKHSSQSYAITLGDKQVLSFCSNDYLALANHPELRAAFKDAVDDYGVGSGASQMICGYHQQQQSLEKELAEFLEMPRAIVFSTGYMANLGVLTALCQRHDTILSDRYNHASLVDGSLFSGANTRRYKHCDYQHLAEHLKKVERGNTFIVTDGVFSMDGDIADLPCLTELAEQHQAQLIVDDAHGLGVMGESGRGSIEHFKLSPHKLTVLTGTFGKSFGGFGAFAAGSHDVIDYLLQFSRPAIFTTAMPPAIASSMRVALKLIQQESSRRSRLHDLIGYFRLQANRRGLPVLDSITPIQPLMVGDSAKALRLSEYLLEKNIHVSAIRPPTVPVNSARLRITLRADHSYQQIDGLLNTIEEQLPLL